MTGLTVEGNHMTEMVNGEGQGSNFGGTPVNSPQSSAPSQAQPESERSFKQSEVNDLVGRAKSEAVERYKRETSITSHSQPAQTHQPSPYQGQPQNGQGYGGGQNQPQTQPLSSDDVRRMAAEETQRLRNEWTQESHRTAQEQDAKRIATEFFTKIEAGKAKYENFDKVMADVDLRSIPYHVQLSNMVDNTADVIYELANNPSKIGQLQSLIDIDLRAGREPRLALAEMKRLSQSIKDNAEATNFKAPNQPLSQLRPSNAGTGKSGALTIGDYKAKYKV